MYTYRDLGLVNTKKMFEKAYNENYAVPALNFVSIEQFNGIIDAVIKKESPVILLISPRLFTQFGPEIIVRISQSGVDRLRREKIVPEISLHLDHGMNFEECKRAIEYGFSSVMIDGSNLPFEENIKVTQKVVEYAHERGVTVEGELGASGYGNYKNYTDPQAVEIFVKQTNVDSLAVSIGTQHGLVKIQPNKDGNLPELRYDILDEISALIPGFPVVLHGSSSIDPSIVELNNQYGGNVKKALGIPEEQLTKASKRSVCKINIATDGWITAMAYTRKILFENRDAIDSRIYKIPIRKILAELYEHKIDIMGSAHKL